MWMQSPSRHDEIGPLPVQYRLLPTGRIATATIWYSAIIRPGFNFGIDLELDLIPSLIPGIGTGMEFTFKEFELNLNYKNENKGIRISLGIKKKVVGSGIGSKKMEFNPDLAIIAVFYAFSVLYGMCQYRYIYCFDPVPHICAKCFCRIELVLGQYWANIGPIRGIYRDVIRAEVTINSPFDIRSGHLATSYAAQLIS